MKILSSHVILNWKGSDSIKNKTAYLTLGVFIVNLFLFILKLYVGLSSNSISIYSDGVNNLFDSLSGLLSFICLGLIIKNEDLLSKFLIGKTEQLLTFIVSVTVGLSGFYFAYSSLERLMYPVPVWYNVRYLYLIIFTAAVKLMMFFTLRHFGKKLSSSVIKAIAFDSLLDFFITSVTVMTLLISKNGTYSIDAFCGIAISTVIIISAVKMIISSVCLLTGFIKKEKREALEDILREVPVEKIRILSFEEETEAYISIQKEECDLVALKEKIKDETDIRAHFFIS